MDADLDVSWGSGALGGDDLEELLNSMAPPPIRQEAESTKSPFTVVKKVKRKLEGGEAKPREKAVSFSEDTDKEEKKARQKQDPPRKEEKKASQKQDPPRKEEKETKPKQDPPRKEEKEAKPKHKSLSRIEDPLQYHAKPKDLSLNALKRPRGEEEEEKEGSNGKPRVATSSAIAKVRQKFTSLPLHAKIIEHLEKAEDKGGFGFLQATFVQTAVVPLLASSSSRQNVLIKSQTGSGKTLAYLLPIVNDLLSIQPNVERGDGTRALVIAPTRELCGQIASVLDKLTQCCVNIVGGCITGGERRKSEKARLRKGIVVLVGTPGRLLDHLKTTESFKLPLLRWVVLDEADRLLDMGFEQSILDILSIVRGERLPGLKAPQPSEGDKERALKDAAANLQQRWAKQSAQRAKVCGDTGGIVHLMASATLTNGVKQLAMPVMGGAGFVVVDSDRGSVSRVETKEDLLLLGAGGGGGGGGSSGATQHGSSSSGGVVDFGNDDEGNGNDIDEQEQEHATKKARTSLVKGEEMEAPEQLAQYYMMVTCKWRLSALVSFLRAHAHQKLVVFFATCDSVDFHALLLREADWPVELDPDFSRQGQGGDADADGQDEGASTAKQEASMKQVLEPLPSHFPGMFGKQFTLYRLHGSVPQLARQAVFKEFCAAKTGVLLCTDVAARGLDLPRVDWILQYDPPCETADYVHRVGRTARKGLGGSALLFLLPSEANYVQLLSSHRLNPEALSLQSLFLDTATRYIPGAAKFKNQDEMAAVILQRRLESVVHSNRPLLAAARQAFRSFVRAYATHSSDTKGIFSVQALHLGHVAKSFALRESPKALHNKEDIMAKIFNGAFSDANSAQNKKLTRKDRDEKYALSNQRSGSGGGGGGGGGSKKKQGKDKQKSRKMGSSSSSAPSGKFRKAGGGYFRKKLRAQTQSEFAN